MAWFAMLAEFSKTAESRGVHGSDRREPGFEAELAASRSSSSVEVLDFSEAGLLLRASDAMDIGEEFEVLLPGTGLIEARVEWRRGTLYGCRFVSPVSRGVVAAAVLKARRMPSGVES